MATTTTNNGWDIPTNTDYVKDGATAIATLGQDIDTSVGTGLLSWTAYTPTFLNFTLGNGTITARYAKLGKNVFFSIFITLGSTSSVTGQILITTPVNPQTNSIYFNTFMLDGSASQAYFGTSEMFGNYLYTRVLGTGGTYATTVATSATIPFTWAVNDQIVIHGTYEED